VYDYLDIYFATNRLLIFEAGFEYPRPHGFHYSCIQVSVANRSHYFGLANPSIYFGPVNVAILANGNFSNQGFPIVFVRLRLFGKVGLGIVDRAWPRDAVSHQINRVRAFRLLGATDKRRSSQTKRKQDQFHARNYSILRESGLLIADTGLGVRLAPAPDLIGDGKDLVRIRAESLF
jgi:hypothetical protein